ncbi:hypothetical protein [Neolewinella litorea]|uniref:Lipocalin-like domain-containing protein n=1 Tax=Neolewinella litorea TaxID=2562452 RepID=A0A4S4N8H9_9BACT|nr:hypothetical protein [Neolewinella litorea]THH34348.1 hypothetical protein E4021_17755 [Neolewinella litorea]
MKFVSTLMYVLLSLGVFSQSEVDLNTKIDLTDDSIKVWKFQKVVETMGSRNITSEECMSDTLIFESKGQTVSGNLCSFASFENTVWTIKKINDDEIYLVVKGVNYMVDIYFRNEGGTRTKTLRLKKLSKEKGLPSIAYYYIEK